MTEKIKVKRPPSVRPKNKVQYYRFERGLGERELARMVGVAQATLRQWESGRSNPNFDNLVKLSQIFGVHYRDLIYFDF